MKVTDVMTTEVVVVDAVMSATVAAARMVTRGVGGLPVVDVLGRVVGIVTVGDLVESSAYDGPDAGSRVNVGELAGRPRDRRWVRDVMTTGVVTASPDDDVATAAGRLLAACVKRLPVVDRDGHLVGIVSRHDLLGAWSGRRAGHGKRPATGRSRGALVAGIRQRRGCAVR